MKIPFLKTRNNSEGQDGGICIGTGSAKQNEISYHGKIYKKGDPNYEVMRKKASDEINERFKL